QPQTPANLPIAGNGTAFAIKYLTLSVAAHLPCRATGRGGARNSAARQSHELSPANIENLLRAARHADAIGLPLNRMITVHWQKAGAGDWQSRSTPGQSGGGARLSLQGCSASHPGRLRY